MRKEGPSRFLYWRGGRRGRKEGKKRRKNEDALREMGGVLENDIASFNVVEGGGRRLVSRREKKKEEARVSPAGKRSV